MATKLHELLAVNQNLRSQAEACRNDLKNTFDKKRTHFSEVVVTFNSLTEGDAPKVETKMGLQSTVRQELDWISEKLAASINAAHQVDIANTEARADVVLEDGTILLRSIPATSLLQLEKRIEEIQDLGRAIPTLDPAKGFTPDPAMGNGIYRARPVEKPRTEKKTEPLVLYPATDKHPAQVEKMVYDKVIGHTVQDEWSSLITVAEKGAILDRAETLLRAVKKARARANEAELDPRSNRIAETLLDFVFGV